jgi:hypothetical protein
MNGRGGGRREEGGGISQSAGVDVFDMVCVAGTVITKGREQQKSGTMVLLLLEIKAELENITNLMPKGGSDGSEYTFFFKV